MEDIKQATQELTKLAGIEKKEDYEKDKINWVDNNFYDCWDKCKGRAKNLWRHKKEYKEDFKWKKFFLAHDKNKIHGKPQLIETVQKRIPLVRHAVKKIKLGTNEAKELNLGSFKNDYIEINSFYFFDEKFDKRHDGFQKEAFALDFWLYRVYSNNKEYYVFSESELPNEECELEGMIIELDDFAEFSRSMKIKSLSRIFIVRKCIPSVEVLPKNKLVELTKNISLDDWLNYISKHEIGTHNRFSFEFEMLRSAFLLSGKTEGYPLHLMIWGKAGRRKTMGILETLDWKFKEEVGIMECGNSRIKALEPSFKEKPANVGYLIKCNRIGLVDEVGKLVDFERKRNQTMNGDYLGTLNAILEHKNRFIGSGNDNNLKMCPTAKYIFTSNACANLKTIYEHCGVIDRTMLSRVINWVQDDNEDNFVLDHGVQESANTISSLYDNLPQHFNKPKSPQHINKSKNSYVNNKIKNDILSCGGVAEVCGGIYTLYDTCCSFLSKFDTEKIKNLVDISSSLAKEPMKSVWKPRALHHIKLLVDGLVKTRCLFLDHNINFTAQEKDYDLAERILVRMINGWNTILIKDKLGGNF